MPELTAAGCGGAAALRVALLPPVPTVCTATNGECSPIGMARGTATAAGGRERVINNVRRVGTSKDHGFAEDGLASASVNRTAEALSTIARVGAATADLSASASISKETNMGCWDSLSSASTDCVPHVVKKEGAGESRSNKRVKGSAVGERYSGSCIESGAASQSTYVAPIDSAQTAYTNVDEGCITEAVSDLPQWVRELGEVYRKYLARRVSLEGALSTLYTSLREAAVETIVHGESARRQLLPKAVTVSRLVEALFRQVLHLCVEGLQKQPDREAARLCAFFYRILGTVDELVCQTQTLLREEQTETDDTKQQQTQLQQQQQQHEESMPQQLPAMQHTEKQTLCVRAIEPEISQGGVQAGPDTASIPLFLALSGSSDKVRYQTVEMLWKRLLQQVATPACPVNVRLGICCFLLHLLRWGCSNAIHVSEAVQAQHREVLLHVLDDAQDAALRRLVLLLLEQFQIPEAQCRVWRAFLLHLDDEAPPVRRAAVSRLLLVDFEVPQDTIPIAETAVKLLLARTHDCSAEVRAAVYKRLSTDGGGGGVLFSGESLGQVHCVKDWVALYHFLSNTCELSLSVEDRELVAVTGLSDKAKSVREACSRMLRSWIIRREELLAAAAEKERQQKEVSVEPILEHQQEEHTKKDELPQQATSEDAAMIDDIPGGEASEQQKRKLPVTTFSACMPELKDTQTEDAVDDFYSDGKSYTIGDLLRLDVDTLPPGLLSASQTQPQTTQLHTAEEHQELKNTAIQQQQQQRSALSREIREDQQQVGVQQGQEVAMQQQEGTMLQQQHHGVTEQQQQQGLEIQQAKQIAEEQQLEMEDTAPRADEQHAAQASKFKPPRRPASFKKLARSALHEFISEYIKGLPFNEAALDIILRELFSVYPDECHVSCLKQILKEGSPHLEVLSPAGLFILRVYVQYFGSDADRCGLNIPDLQQLLMRLLTVAVDRERALQSRIAPIDAPEADVAEAVDFYRATEKVLLTLCVCVRQLVLLTCYVDMVEQEQALLLDDVCAQLLMRMPLVDCSRLLHSNVQPIELQVASYAAAPPKLGGSLPVKAGTLGTNCILGSALWPGYWMRSMVPGACLQLLRRVQQVLKRDGNCGTPPSHPPPLADTDSMSFLPQSASGEVQQSTTQQEHTVTPLSNNTPQQTEKERLETDFNVRMCAILADICDPFEAPIPAPPQEQQEEEEEGGAEGANVGGQRDLANLVETFNPALEDIREVPMRNYSVAVLQEQHELLVNKLLALRPKAVQYAEEALAMRQRLSERQQQQQQAEDDQKQQEQQQEGEEKKEEHEQQKIVKEQKQQGKKKEEHEQQKIITKVQKQEESKRKKEEKQQTHEIHRGDNSSSVVVVASGTDADDEEETSEATDEEKEAKMLKALEQQICYMQRECHRSSLLMMVVDDALQERWLRVFSILDAYLAMNDTGYLAEPVLSEVPYAMLLPALQHYCNTEDAPQLCKDSCCCDDCLNWQQPPASTSSGNEAPRTEEETLLYGWCWRSKDRRHIALHLGAALRSPQYTDFCELLVTKCMGCFSLLSWKEIEAVRQLKAYHVSLLTSLGELQSATTALEQLHVQRDAQEIHRMRLQGRLQRRQQRIARLQERLERQRELQGEEERELQQQQERQQQQQQQDQTQRDQQQEDQQQQHEQEHQQQHQQQQLRPGGENEEDLSNGGNNTRRRQEPQAEGAVEGGGERVPCLEDTRTTYPGQLCRKPRQIIMANLEKQLKYLHCKVAATAAQCEAASRDIQQTDAEIEEAQEMCVPHLLRSELYCCFLGDILLCHPRLLRNEVLKQRCLVQEQLQQHLEKQNGDPTSTASFGTTAESSSGNDGLGGASSATALRIEAGPAAATSTAGGAVSTTAATTSTVGEGTLAASATGPGRILTLHPVSPRRQLAQHRRGRLSATLDSPLSRRSTTTSSAVEEEDENDEEAEDERQQLCLLDLLWQVVTGDEPATKSVQVTCLNVLLKLMVLLLVGEDGLLTETIDEEEDEQKTRIEEVVVGETLPSSLEHRGLEEKNEGKEETPTDKHHQSVQTNMQPTQLLLLNHQEEGQNQRTDPQQQCGGGGDHEEVGEQHQQLTSTAKKAKDPPPKPSPALVARIMGNRLRILMELIYLQPALSSSASGVLAYVDSLLCWGFPSQQKLRSFYVLQCFTCLQLPTAAARGALSAFYYAAHHMATHGLRSIFRLQLTQDDPHRMQRQEAATESSNEGHDKHELRISVAALSGCSLYTHASSNIPMGGPLSVAATALRGTRRTETKCDPLAGQVLAQQARMHEHMLLPSLVRMLGDYKKLLLFIVSAFRAAALTAAHRAAANAAPEASTKSEGRESGGDSNTTTSNNNNNTGGLRSPPLTTGSSTSLTHRENNDRREGLVCHNNAANMGQGGVDEKEEVDTSAEGEEREELLSGTEAIETNMEKKTGKKEADGDEGTGKDISLKFFELLAVLLLATEQHVVPLMVLQSRLRFFEAIVAAVSAWLLQHGIVCTGGKKSEQRLQQQQHVESGSAAPQDRTEDSDGRDKSTHTAALPGGKQRQQQGSGKPHNKQQAAQDDSGAAATTIIRKISLLELSFTDDNPLHGVRLVVVAKTLLSDLLAKAQSPTTCGAAAVTASGATASAALTNGQKKAVKDISEALQMVKRAEEALLCRVFPLPDGDTYEKLQQQGAEANSTEQHIICDESKERAERRATDREYMKRRETFIQEEEEGGRALAEAMRRTYTEELENCRKAELEAFASPLLTYSSPALAALEHHQQQQQTAAHQVEQALAADASDEELEQDSEGEEELEIDNEEEKQRAKEKSSKEESREGDDTEGKNKNVEGAAPGEEIVVARSLPPRRCRLVAAERLQQQISRSNRKKRSKREIHRSSSEADDENDNDENTGQATNAATTPNITTRQKKTNKEKKEMSLINEHASESSSESSDISDFISSASSASDESRFSESWTTDSDDSRHAASRSRRRKALPISRGASSASNKRNKLSSTPLRNNNTLNLAEDDQQLAKRKRQLLQTDAAQLAARGGRAGGTRGRPRRRT